MTTILTSGGLTQPRPADADESLYEVVGGRRMEVLPMGAWENRIANNLARAIWLFWGKQRQGHVDVEMLYALTPEGDVQRRPDVAFVSFARWPEDRPIPDESAWPVVPNLVVEVVSPSNLALELQGKIDDYFSHGVQQVWLVLPPQRRLHKRVDS